MPKNISELSGRKGLKDNLFHKISDTLKKDKAYIPERFSHIADEFLVGKANILGTASFYDFTKEENLSKKIHVCNGSACMVAGTQEALKFSLSEKLSAEEIGEMCCLGRCYEHHAFQYEGKNYAGPDVNTFLKGDLNTRSGIPFTCIGTPILTAPELDDAALSLFISELMVRSKEDILEQIKKSGLRGRGGAGFPISIKLETVMQDSNPVKFIVCNADEGDPGAFSDRYIMEERPSHLLLGMIIAGKITGAEDGVLYIRGEYPESIEKIAGMIRVWNTKGYTGENSITGFSFHIIEGMGAYICGEETALLNSIEGQRPEVRTRPPFPAQSGLFNKPTIVNNVETLACLPWIISNGGDAFQSLGRGKSTGTKLVSLDGFFVNPGIVETDMGTPLSKIINEVGGGFKSPVKAMHIGGPLGGLVPFSKIDKLSLDFESFQQEGFLLGHASIVCIPENYSIAEYIYHLFAFTAHESCGKCFPCRLGSTRGKELMNNAIQHQHKIDRELFQDLLETMESGSLCALGGGLPLPIKNALQHFPQELNPYFH